MLVSPSQDRNSKGLLGSSWYPDAFICSIAVSTQQTCGCSPCIAEQWPSSRFSGKGAENLRTPVITGIRERKYQQSPHHQELKRSLTLIPRPALPLPLLLVFRRSLLSINRAAVASSRAPSYESGTRVGDVEDDDADC